MPIEYREKAYHSPPNILQEGKKISLICQFSMKNRPCGTVPSYGTVNSHVNYCQNTIRNEELISHNFLYVCSSHPRALIFMEQDRDKSPGHSRRVARTFVSIPF